MTADARTFEGDDLGFSFAATIRARTLIVRLTCMALIGVLLGAVGHWSAAALWLGGYLLVQAFLLSLSTIRTRGHARTHAIAFYIASFVNFTIAGIPSWHMWTAGGDLGRVAATMFLCGMLIQLITSCMTARILFWASATPLIGYLTFVPLFAFGLERWGDGVTTMICAMLLVAYMTVLWMGQQRALEQVMEGRRRADRLRFEAEGANQAKTDFLAVMSHEVRTPMNAVLGAAKMLDRDDLTAEQRAHVAMISDAGQVLMDVLNDVLDLAKIEAGKLSIAPEATDVRALVRRCTETWRAAARSKGLTFDVRVADDVPDVVLIDGARTAQILFNLLSNAVKFTDAGSVEVRVGAERGASADVTLTFAVVDSGCGIGQQAMGRLFNAFEQADNSISRRFGGTGLGLAISQRLAQMMGGEITVSSTARTGSTFVLRLAVANAILAPTLAPTPTAPAATGADLRILVAEDNPANQRIVALFLQPLGADVTIVANGLEALDALAVASFDVVLMDMQMPLMDGLEATRRLRASKGPNARTPVIALTANVMDAQRQACRDAGMNAHVAKPIDAAVLIDCIMQTIETSGPYRLRAAN